MNNKLKQLLIIFIVIIFIIFTYVSITVIGRINKEKIIINYAPSFATLTINGKKSSGNTHYLKPGIYEIKLQYDNFNTEITTLNTTSDKEISLILIPSNQSGEALVKNNPQYNKDVEKIVSQANNYSSQKQKDIYPFRDMLPIEMGIRYTIGYGEKTKDNKNPNKYTMALYVDSDSAYSRHLALKTISTQLQINPSNIEIVFKDTNNPFKENENNE